MNGSNLMAKFGNIDFAWRKDERKNRKYFNEICYTLCVAHAKCRCANDRKINITFIEIFMISGH